MKDIPVFTGAHGVATLVLRQIPWSGCGYVLVRSVWDDAAAFLEECRGFCRACGAEQVYASWEDKELPAPHGYDMICMEREKEGLPPATLVCEPLTQALGEEYTTVYNTCFRDVPNAVAFTKEDLARVLREETAIIVRRDGVVAGLAEVSTKGLEAIAVLPQYKGLGYELALTALQMVPSKTIALKATSTNHRAIRLYERLGFKPTAVLSRWWKLQ